MDRNFAELVDEAARRLGLNDYQLSAAIGLLEGNRVFSSKQVSRLRTGQQRHYDDRELIARLIKVLHLTEEEADELWLSADQRPPDLDLAGYRRFRQLASARPVHVLREYLEPAGQKPILVPVPDDLGGLIEPLRHPGDRRQRDRRRPRPVLPQLVKEAA